MATTGNFATTSKPRRTTDIAQLLGQTNTVYNAYLSLCSSRAISLLTDTDLRYLVQNTAAFSRYIGFRHTAPPVGTDGYVLFMSENAHIANARCKSILGITGHTLISLIADIVNLTNSGEDVLLIAGWAFSAIELASTCLLVMNAPSFALTMTNRDDQGPFGSGNVFLSLMAIHRVLGLMEQKMANDNSALVYRLFTQLRHYLHAFSNALVYMTVYYMPQYVSLIGQFYARASMDNAKDEDKLRYACSVGLLNFVSMTMINQIAMNPDAGLGFHTWSNLYEVLPKYEQLSKNRAPVKESVITSIAEKNANVTPTVVMEQLQAACRGATTYDQSVLGKCDTDFLTMRTSMPCTLGAETLRDPALSTSLHSHNALIAISTDTLPVQKATANYNMLKANTDTMKVRIGAMSLVSLIVKCAFATREDRRFMMTFVYSDTSEMHTFLEQSCSVSPSNMGTFLRCLNFELMDTKLYTYMMWCIQHTLNMPVPRTVLYRTYANNTLWRMGTNLFYHNYFSRGLDDDQTYYYDSEFFPTFGSWMECTRYVESQIPYKVPALILSSIIVFSSIFLSSQMKSTHAAMTVLNADQRSLAEMWQLLVKEIMADESELSVLIKGLLENVLLPVYKDTFRGNHMVYSSFVSPTALRMFLSRCRWSLTDDIVMMAVDHTPFTLRLLSPPGDMQTPSERAAKRQRLENVHQIINSVTRMAEASPQAAAAAAAPVYDGFQTKLPMAMLNSAPVMYG